MYNEKERTKTLQENNQQVGSNLNKEIAIEFKCVFKVRENVI